MSESPKKQEILLESGTNELEVLVFSVGKTRYGVNVAKVREIIGHVRVVKVPLTHSAVVGVFKLRDSVIPLVDLQLYFDPVHPSEATQRAVILMEFNNLQIGFLVDSVDRIFRLSWSEVQPMPTVENDAHSVITSVCKTDGQFALMVDFEKIAFDINRDDQAFRTVYELSDAGPVDREAQHILLAEDSQTIRMAIRSNLLQAGYTNVTAAPHGAEAWAVLERSLDQTDAPPFTVVVTDIEMPQMDGLHLCKRIKEHPTLKRLPVIVFSSLVSDSNLNKCEAVGATAALTKPQMTRLVGLLDRLFTGVGLDVEPVEDAVPAAVG